MKKALLRIGFVIPALALLIPGTVVGLESTLPTLSIEKGSASQRLEIRDLAVEVECLEHLVEITYDITYYNGSKRNQEGEFHLELPPGSQVSSYSLEVNGKMRPAVSVESKKALNAYETIKRRGVDPGIVEKVGENSYRTRIFPILPQSTKRVRISYLQRIPASGQFPLSIKHDAEVGSFRITVKGARRVEENEAKQPEEPETLAGFVITGEDTTPNDTFLLQSELSPSPSYKAFHDEQNVAHFLVQGAVPEAKPPEPLSWPQLRLIWDASRSRDPDQKETELKALRELWKTLGTAEVSLQILQETLSEPQVFPIKEGRSPSLEKAISKIFYDGVADFSILPPSQFPTLLVSDGLVSSPLFAPQETPRSDHFLLALPEASPSNSLIRSGFRSVRLREKNWVRTLLQPALPYHVKGLLDEEWTVTEKNDRFFLTGRCDRTRMENLAIEIAGSPAITIRETAAKGEWNLLRRVHSLQRLADLEAEGLPNEILLHAKRERLASDFTSLIVLEEFRDHIQFEIPPPEKDLLERYEEELSKKTQFSLLRAQRAWDSKRSNYDLSNVWIDYHLTAEVDTVSIWLNATKKLFPEAKRNQREAAPYEKWTEQSREILLRKETLKTGKDVAEWKTDLDQQIEALEKIRALPPTPLVDDKIHVSVRGFITNRGILSQEGHLSLRKAIREMGDPNHYGSLRRVYLYRNATRTGYNMKNPSYVPVTLEWGDMVVVESEPIPDYGFADGFAVDAFADPFMDARAGGGDNSTPAVFEEKGIARGDQGSGSNRTSGGADPFGSGGPGPRSGSNEDMPVPTGEMTLPIALPRGLDEKIIETFRASKDLAETYRVWLEKTSSKASLSTIVEISRALFQAGENELGLRCLSNLIELQENPVEATRSVAFWLAEFGLEKEAIRSLTILLETPLDSATRELLHHDLGRISGSVDSFQSSIKEGINGKRPSPVTISLVDLFRLGGTDSTKQFDTDSLESDLRIVVSTAGGDLIPELEEPAEAEKWRNWGAITTSSPRVSELLVRRAWPGIHEIRGRNWDPGDDPVTVRIEIYTNWGRDSEKVIRKTIWVNERSVILGEIDFAWE